MKKIKTVEDFFALVVPAAQVSAFLKLHIYTVERWRQTGIPKKYWIDMMDEYDLDREEIKSLGKGSKK